MADRYFDSDRERWSEDAEAYRDDYDRGRQSAEPNRQVAPLAADRLDDSYGLDQPQFELLPEISKEFLGRMAAGEAIGKVTGA